MGNKQNKENNNIRSSHEAFQNKQPGSVSQTKQKQNGGGCFGSKKTKDNVRKQTVSNTQLNGSYAHDTRKSSILVKSMPNAKADDKLFADRQKTQLQIKMKRAQPYQIQKDSDYFDSQLNGKSGLENLGKVYDSCQIANYQTPQTQKLQTVQVKTYLFDRNLTKIQA